jgi:hypothetical protein
MLFSIESQLRATLGDALSALSKSTDQLCQQLTLETSYPLWVWQTSNSSHARMVLTQHVAALNFADGQDANNTLTCSSLIGTSLGTISLIHQVNRQRKEVTKILRNMDDKKLQVEDKNTKQSHFEKLTKVALTAYGFPRLHRKQIMRPFEVLSDQPERVGFTWARIRKSEKISSDQAKIKIHNLIDRAASDSRHAFLQQDLEKINQLDPNEPLAIVNPPHLHARANIVWSDGCHVKRQTKRAVVPIFYPAKANSALPVIKPLADTPPAEGHRMKRRDMKIQEQPYLLSIKVHRYIQHASQ